MVDTIPIDIHLHGMDRHPEHPKQIINSFCWHVTTLALWRIMVALVRLHVLAEEDGVQLQHLVDATCGTVCRTTRPSSMLLSVFLDVVWPKAPADAGPANGWYYTCRLVWNCEELIGILCARLLPRMGDTINVHVDGFEYVYFQFYMCIPAGKWLVNVDNS